MKQLLVVSIALGALSLPVAGRLEAQGQGGGNGGLTGPWVGGGSIADIERPATSDPAPERGTNRLQRCEDKSCA